MDKNTANSIQRARLSAGLTQEALAEAAGYSPDSVRAWETGSRSCPLEVLGILGEILAAPWLTGVYLREHYRSLAPLIPEFRVGRPLPEAAAEYISEVLDLIDVRFDRTLLRMVADGKIGDDEAPVFGQIVAQAEQTIKAFYEMKFSRKG